MCRSLDPLYGIKGQASDEEVYNALYENEI